MRESGDSRLPSSDDPAVPPESAGRPSSDDSLAPAAVAALFAEHGEELRRFIQGVVRDGNLVADVLQATFLKASQKGRSARQESLKGWLFRVALNEALAIRRRRRTDEQALRQAAWRTNEGTQEPADALARREAVEKIRSALGDLSLDEQRVVRMRVYEEKTFAAIAQELGLPLGTVLTRMRRALQRMREILGAHGEEP